MSHRLTRFALATATGAASVLLSATPADAGLVGCAAGAVDTSTLTVYVGPTVNCAFDTAGNCLYYYDPLFSFPTLIVPETTEYAFCHV